MGLPVLAGPNLQITSKGVKYNMWVRIFVQQIVNGLSIGCVYGLIALGYTMVYGVLRTLNFAHGQLFTVGPMIALTVMKMLNITGKFNVLIAQLSGTERIMVVIMCILVGGALAAVLGVIIERAVYRPLRAASSLTVLLAILGVSIFLQNATMLIFGADTKAFPRMLPTFQFRIMGAVISSIQLLIALVTILLLAGLFYIVNRTYIGRCMRAVAEDKDIASLMGVDINRAIAFVFLIGPALGGASGVLYSIQYQRAIYSMGNVIGMKGWVVSILGGIGNIKGAVVAGLFLGLVETLATGYLPVFTGGALGTEYRDIFAFIMLILTLIFRPYGLFGEAVETK